MQRGSLGRRARLVLVRSLDLVLVGVHGVDDLLRSLVVGSLGRDIRLSDGLVGVVQGDSDTGAASFLGNERIPQQYRVNGSWPARSAPKARRTRPPGGGPVAAAAEGRAVSGRGIPAAGSGGVRHRPGAAGAPVGARQRQKVSRRSTG
ncbi:hypothetical protein GCM10025734_38160 [Kitasatospora paranensis]